MSQSIQVYDVHLVDGSVLHEFEPFDYVGARSIESRYKKANDNEIITIGNAWDGTAFVAKRNILFICTGDVIAGWDGEPSLVYQRRKKNEQSKDGN